jgi:hypothetical protein
MDDVGWIRLAQDKDMWPVHINTVLELPGSIKCEEILVCVKNYQVFQERLVPCSYFGHYFCSWSDSSSSALNMKDSGVSKILTTYEITRHIPCSPSERFWVQTSVHRPAIQTDVSLTFTLAYPFQRVSEKYIILGHDRFPYPF